MNEMTTQEHADWLVYSREHNAWWRPKAAGYCTHIDGAGRYTKETAEACASSRSVTDPEAPPEFAVPAPEAYEAIAARLKALEFAVMRAPHSAGCPQSGLHLQSYVAGKIYTTRPDAKADCICWKSAILDTAREVEK